MSARIAFLKHIGVDHVIDYKVMGDLTEALLLAVCSAVLAAETTNLSSPISARVAGHPGG